MVVAVICSNLSDQKDRQRNYQDRITLLMYMIQSLSEQTILPEELIICFYSEKYIKFPKKLPFKLTLLRQYEKLFQLEHLKKVSDLIQSRENKPNGMLLLDDDDLLDPLLIEKLTANGVNSNEAYYGYLFTWKEILLENSNTFIKKYKQSYTVISRNIVDYCGSIIGIDILKDFFDKTDHSIYAKIPGDIYMTSWIQNLYKINKINEPLVYYRKWYSVEE